MKVPKEWEFETIEITQKQFYLLIDYLTDMTINVARQRESIHMGGHYPLWPTFEHELDQLFLDHGNLIMEILKGEITE